jgi:TonB family protein
MSPLLLALALLSSLAGPADAPAAGKGPSASPVLVAKVDPEYPESARRAYRTGKVVLSFTVQVSGAVTDIEIVQSAGPDLDTAAIQAVSRWRYEPATEAGDSVMAHGTVSIPFSLELEGRVLDAGADPLLVLFDRGTPDLALPRRGQVLRLRANHPQGEPTAIGAVSIERRVPGGDRPTYEARLGEGGPLRAGDIVRVTLGP